MKSEGPFSLYKGTVAPLLGNMVLLGIHFPTFTKTRTYLESDDAPGTFTPWKILAAGAAAGAAGSVVSSPTELIRTKMQMVRKNNILAQMKGAAVGGLNPEENYKVRPAGDVRKLRKGQQAVVGRHSMLMCCRIDAVGIVLKSVLAARARTCVAVQQWWTAAW
jgi:hypothetical protein